MADHVNDDDDLMFGEMPEDDDLNGAGGDESEIDANNDETFGGPLPTSNANVELEDYATQTADLNLDDIWDIPSCSAAAPPASDLPMPSSFFTNFGENSFDFLGSGSKVWGQSKTDDYSWPDMPSLPSHYEKTPLDLPPVAMPSIQQMTPLQQSALPPVIPTMPKAPTLHEIERMQVEESRARQIPAIPSTAMSSEELEKKILQESRANNQVNGTPAMSIPPLMGNVPRNPMALGLCPPIPPIFVPCFAPWLDLLMRRTQSLPPGCPPPPPFVLGLMNRFGNPNMVMNIMRSAVTPPGMPPTFVPPPISHLSSTAITPSYHHYHRKPPGMPSAKTIEDLAFDQFAGYMSIKERQWLVKIQILQCQGTNNPYEDDYYYVCWRQKKIAEGMQPKEVKDSEKSETKEIINGSRQARRNRERKESTCEREPVDRVTTLATRFAGSLGIPTKASTHNPRHSIRVQHSEPLDEDQEKRAAGSQKKLRTLLMKIEGATSLLIECQDRRVALQNATSQANRDALVQEISERVSTVMKETFQEEFYRVMQVSKGRALISRVVRVGMPADVCRMIRLLIAQSRVTQNAKYLPDVEEGVFPSIYRGLMTFPREDILAILSSPILKINDLQIALSEKNTFARDLLFLLLLVCSVKKVSISCHLFDWVRSIAPLDLSSGWSFSETALWNLLSVGRDDVHNLASWLCHLVSENSHGTVASQIAQRLRLY